MANSEDSDCEVVAEINAETRSRVIIDLCSDSDTDPTSDDGERISLYASPCFAKSSGYSSELVGEAEAEFQTFLEQYKHHHTDSVWNNDHRNSSGSPLDPKSSETDCAEVEDRECIIISSADSDFSSGCCSDESTSPESGTDLSVALNHQVTSVTLSRKRPKVPRKSRGSKHIKALPEQCNESEEDPSSGDEWTPHSTRKSSVSKGRKQFRGLSRRKSTTGDSKESGGVKPYKTRQRTSSADSDDTVLLENCEPPVDKSQVLGDSSQLGDCGERPRLKSVIRLVSSTNSRPMYKVVSSST